MSDTPAPFDGFDVPPENAVEGQPVRKAVALKYERGVDEAPHVVAAGRGVFAEQILHVAFERGIKVREDADLIEILSAIDVDSPIPLEAFAAVAEILSYVYAANASFAQRRAANMHKEG